MNISKNAHPVVARDKPAARRQKFSLASEKPGIPAR